MQQAVYILSDNIISSLGHTTDENLQHLTQGESGIKLCTDPAFSIFPFYTSRIDYERLLGDFKNFGNGNPYTKLEKMLILSVSEALKQCEIDPSSPRTLMILSSTKGNIDLLDEPLGFDRERIYLWKLAQIIGEYFQCRNTPLIISNACISGLMAILVGKRLIEDGSYDHVIVSGADLVTHFVVSGFQSFKAVSPDPCKPFDIMRDGITLGEAAGTIILGKETQGSDISPVKITGGASSNDANHISGPSRTGDGLFLALRKAMTEAGLTAEDIGHISAHGTATVFNDEMESRAFGLAGLTNVPVNSLKGYWGHTLGAAGIIEAIAGIHSMKNNYLIKTLGFNTLGVPVGINVICDFRGYKQKNFLKTASGFGGCNAAVIFEKS